MWRMSAYKLNWKICLNVREWHVHLSSAVEPHARLMRYEGWPMPVHFILWTSWSLMLTSCASCEKCLMQLLQVKTCLKLPHAKTRLTTRQLNSKCRNMPHAVSAVNDGVQKKFHWTTKQDWLVPQRWDCFSFCFANSMCQPALLSAFQCGRQSFDAFRIFFETLRTHGPVEKTASRQVHEVRSRQVALCDRATVIACPMEVLRLDILNQVPFNHCLKGITSDVGLGLVEVLLGLITALVLVFRARRSRIYKVFPSSSASRSRFPGHSPRAKVFRFAMSSSSSEFGPKISSTVSFAMLSSVMASLAAWARCWRSDGSP